MRTCLGPSSPRVLFRGTSVLQTLDEPRCDFWVSKEDAIGSKKPWEINFNACRYLKDLTHSRESSSLEGGSFSYYVWSCTGPERKVQLIFVIWFPPALSYKGRSKADLFFLFALGCQWWRNRGWQSNLCLGLPLFFMFKSDLFTLDLCNKWREMRSLGRWITDFETWFRLPFLCSAYYIDGGWLAQIQMCNFWMYKNRADVYQLVCLMRAWGLAR